MGFLLIFLFIGKVDRGVEKVDWRFENSGKELNRNFKVRFVFLVFLYVILYIFLGGLLLMIFFLVFFRLK